MKKLSYVSCALVVIAVACSFAASTAIRAKDIGSGSAPARSSDNARLFVSRAANFGTVDSVHLFIDGVEVTELGLSQSYATLLRPGQHLLSISTTPNPYGKTMLTQRRINAKPGKTYAFTAVWKDPERASLQKSPRT